MARGLKWSESEVEKGRQINEKKLADKSKKNGRIIEKNWQIKLGTMRGDDQATRSLLHRKRWRDSIDHEFANYRNIVL